MRHFFTQTTLEMAKTAKSRQFAYFNISEKCRWLVGCFGFNGPLRQYFSLYRAAPKEREKEKRKDR